MSLSKAGKYVNSNKIKMILRRFLQVVKTNRDNDGFKKDLYKLKKIFRNIDILLI